MMRTDWTFEEIYAIYNTPLLELVFQAAKIHRQYHPKGEIQVCTLLSIKTGGCTEDCAYCPQAARYKTNVEVHKMMEVDEVLLHAQQAKDAGSSRFCMGAAWREVRDNRDFDKILDMVKGINGIGLEVCCTLGMLNADQAQKLKDAGLYAYNHNLDTSEDHYDKIISTRVFDDRIKTIGNVRKAGISVCSGGIIGMGEPVEARIGMIHTLATMPKHPESVPVNALVAVEGTPLENMRRVPIWDMIRMIATVRIVMPTTMVRLSAGRMDMSTIEQAFCFMAGANSIFSGDKLLTTPNPSALEDEAMFELLGLSAMEPFAKVEEKVSLAEV